MNQLKEQPLEQLLGIDCFTVWMFHGGSYWVCHWKKTFWVGGCDEIGCLAYLLFCAAYWSRQPRVFRPLSRSCLYCWQNVESYDYAKSQAASGMFSYQKLLRFESTDIASVMIDVPSIVTHLWFANSTKVLKRLTDSLTHLGYCRRDTWMVPVTIYNLSEVLEYFIQ